MNLATTYDKIFKILLLGDCSVGKTCFLVRYVDDTFKDNHITTIGVDFKTKILEDEKNSELIKLQIWDTAGQDKFRCITKNYFRGSNGILLIYDITSPSSFKNIRNWISQIRDSLKDEACIVLVGNKVDLENDRKIDTDKGIQLAKEFNINHFFETSAKNNYNINIVFEKLVKQMQDNSKNKIEEDIKYLNKDTTPKNNNNQNSPERNRSLSYKLDRNTISSNDKEKKKWC